MNVRRDDKAWAVIAAGGSGRRMGAAVNKLFLPLADRPLLAHTLEAFEAASSVGRVVVAARAEDGGACRELVDRYGFGKVVDIVAGGAERQDTVAAGLAAVAGYYENCEGDGGGHTIVAVHDGARPLATPALIDRTVAAARRHGAALAALPARETVKVVDAAGRVENTPARDSLHYAQTPQAFRLAVLREAMEKAAEEGVRGTDEAFLVERLGHPVQVIEGEERNIKVTTPSDLAVAECYLGRWSGGEAGVIRVGFGMDVHPFQEGRALVLGGVRVPHSPGLGGHSDADVLAHAVIDALMGAAGKGDIGRRFPDTDERFRDADSLALLAEVVAALRGERWRVGNLDATVAAESPRLAPHVGEMERRLAAVLGMGPGRVNVKATTTEGLGFVGRREGIAAYAVATLIRG